jgi:hypothetical protein
MRKLIITLQAVGIGVLLALATIDAFAGDYGNAAVAFAAAVMLEALMAFLPERQGPAAPYTMRRRGEDGEGDRVAPPMALRRAPETYGSARGGQRMCLDTRTQRPVDPALCERESRRLQNR